MAILLVHIGGKWRAEYQNSFALCQQKAKEYVGYKTKVIHYFNLNKYVN
jgi:hypothetical protein